MLTEVGRDMTESLGTELPKEMARVRDLLPLYDAIPAGIFAATIMRHELDNAARALAEGDLPAMIRSYDALKGYSE
jgi:hypothetical protein